VSPNRREREYERRRYQEWQDRRQDKARRAARRRRVMMNVGAALAAVAVVGVVVVVMVLGNRGDNGPTTQLATSPSASPSGEPSPSSSAGAAPNPCPAPPANAPKPGSWKTAPPKSDAAGKAFTVTLSTSCGDIGIALDGAKAPQAVASTVFLAKNGFYNNTPCHRLTTAGIFVLQCGDPTGTGGGGPGFSYGPVENAPGNNVYPAGTVAMARQGDNGSSMGSQFFLVYKESSIPSDSAGGYTVMGRITSGLDVLQKIAEGGVKDGGSDGGPARPVSIVSTSVKAG
jgi:peptidyl-prolyl cis-trans isomerase B (cyclophilin B)